MNVQVPTRYHGNYYYYGHHLGCWLYMVHVLGNWYINYYVFNTVIQDTGTGTGIIKLCILLHDIHECM